MKLLKIEYSEPNIHDNLACDVINELEYWKEKQKEIFNEEVNKYFIILKYYI